MEDNTVLLGDVPRTMRIRKGWGADLETYIRALKHSWLYAGFAVSHACPIDVSRPSGQGDLRLPGG